MLKSFAVRSARFGARAHFTRVDLRLFALLLPGWLLTPAWLHDGEEPAPVSWTRARLFVARLTVAHLVPASGIPSAVKAANSRPLLCDCLLHKASVGEDLEAS